jgi:hypothetical protein
MEQYERHVRPGARQTANQEADKPASETAASWVDRTLNSIQR